MKRILFVIESLGGGGAEKVLTTIVKHLDKKKFDVTVLLVVEKGVYVEEMKKYCKVQSMLPDYEKLINPLDKIKYKLDYKFIYTAKSEKVYEKYVKEEYDVEIAFVEGYVTRLISAGSDCARKIAWVHVDPIERSYADTYFNSIGDQRKAYEKYEKVICVSNSVLKSFEKKMQLSHNVIVIYNPIDKEEIRKKITDYRNNKKENRKLKFVSVGRLEKQKGYDRLIEAFSHISKDCYELKIVGEGTLRKELEYKIKAYGLEKNIYLIGFQKNPYRYMANADIFICSSRAEGYSLAIAEAMILGLPIITTKCSGPNELVENGKYGIMVDNSLDGILDGIKQVIGNENKIETLKSLSIERNEVFSIKKTVNQIENILLGED